MNIKDLQNLNIQDLKNMDWESLKDHIIGHPNRTVNILIICVTIISVFMAFRMWVNTTKTLEVEKTALQEKSEALDKFKITQNQIRDFFSKAPETISESRMIEILSEFALDSGVQIVSLSPTTKESDKYTHLTNINITIDSINYVGIIRFMHKLENSSYLLRIKGWSGAPSAANQSKRRFGWGGSSRTQAKKIVKDEHIKATIQIETVEFINE